MLTWYVVSIYRKNTSLSVLIGRITRVGDAGNHVCLGRRIVYALGVALYSSLIVDMQLLLY